MCNFEYIERLYNTKHNLFRVIPAYTMSATLVTSPRPWSGYIHNVLEYASWRERFFFFLSSKETFKSTKSDLFWLWLCRCLQNDYHLYVPAKLPRGETWKRFFHDLWAYRNLFMLVTPQALLVDFSAPSAASANRFKINVFSRFKPFSDTNKENMEDTRKEVSLPLHQRLQLIKLSKKVSSNSVALRYLKEEGDWFGEKWRNIKSGSATLQTDQMNHQKDRLVASVQSIDPGTGRVVMVAADVGLREFAFDGVFPPTTSQDTIYDTCARRHVADFLNGFNSSIVVYGYAEDRLLHFALNALIIFTFISTQTNGFWKDFYNVWRRYQLGRYYWKQENGFDAWDSPSSLC